MFKKYRKLVIGICLGFSISCLFLTAPAVAVPQYLNYQGVLRDNYGSLVTGTKAMTFKVYDVATGGTALFSMITPEVAVNNGLYNVKLGPLGNAELSSGPRWLEVAIGTDTLAPRLEILSVAYAVTAGSSDTASYATLSGTASTAATAANAINATNAATVNGISASTTATAGQLLALDGNKTLVGAAISAEASGSNFALFSNGRIGAAENISVGSDSIAAGGASKTISNVNVTANSRIFLTIAATAYTFPNNTGIRLKTITPGTSFVVETLNAGIANATQPMPFYYLIIN